MWDYSSPSGADVFYAFLLVIGAPVAYVVVGSATAAMAGRLANVFFHKEHWTLPCFKIGLVCSVVLLILFLSNVLPPGLNSGSKIISLVLLLYTLTPAIVALGVQMVLHRPTPSEQSCDNKP